MVRARKRCDSSHCAIFLASGHISRESSLDEKKVKRHSVFAKKKMSSLRKKIRRKSPPRFANISHVSHDPAQRVTFAEPSTLVATLPARVAAFDNRHSRLDLGQPSTARGLLTDGNLFRLEKREIFAARRGARQE